MSLFVTPATPRISTSTTSAEKIPFGLPSLPPAETSDIATAHNSSLLSDLEQHGNPFSSPALLERKASKPITLVPSSIKPMVSSRAFQALRGGEALIQEACKTLDPQMLPQLNFLKQNLAVVKLPKEANSTLDRMCRAIDTVRADIKIAHAAPAA